MVLEASTHSIDGGSTSVNETEFESTFEGLSRNNSSLDVSRQRFSTSAETLPPPIPTFSSVSSLETSATRQMHETSPRPRHPPNPLSLAPDVSSQILLRKRILEIQALNLPEGEKARLVQV